MTSIDGVVGQSEQTENGDGRVMTITGPAAPRRARAEWLWHPWLIFARRTSYEVASSELSFAASDHAADSDHPAGDRFESLFARFHQRIFGYLWRMTGDEQAAHDLTQETFVRAWKHFDAIGSSPEPAPWLFRVASNLARTHRKRGIAAPSLQLDAQQPGATDPGRRIAERDVISQALQSLTPNQRAALVLHEVYGLSCEEIGQVLRISRAAVKMALWRAREGFRVQYLREDEGAAQ